MTRQTEQLRCPVFLALLDKEDGQVYLLRLWQISDTGGGHRVYHFQEDIKMDIGRSFTYVTQDQDWIKKVLLGGVITLIPVVGPFFALGYVLETMRNIISIVRADLT